MTDISWSGQAAPALENAPVIVRIPEDHRWVPAYPTSGIAIEFQFLSLFVTVSFLILDR